MSAISSACSPASGCAMYSLSMSTPTSAAYLRHQTKSSQNRFVGSREQAGHDSKVCGQHVVIQTSSKPWIKSMFDVDEAAIPA